MSAFRSPGVRSDWLFLVLIAGVGTAMSLWLWRSVSREEWTRDEVVFLRQVETRHALIRQTLAGYEDSLLAMRVLMSHGGGVEQEKFSRVAQTQLARYPGFLGVQWAPRVGAGERADWERIHAGVLGERGRIWQRTASGQDSVADERPEYYPILLVAPWPQNRHVIGNDALASPLRSVFATAVARDGLALSGILKLVYESGPNDGIVMTCAVPGAAAAAGAGAAPVKGFLLGVFRVEDLLRQPWDRAPGSQVDVMFVDESVARPDRRVLFCQLTAGGGGSWPSEEEFRRAPHQRMELPIAGRKWSVLYRRADHRVTAPTLMPALALAAGLTVTALGANLLFLQMRRARTVERLVQERTAELSESRRQLGALMHALPGLVFRGAYGETLQLTFLSAGVKDLTGYEAAELLGGGAHWRDLIHPEDLRWVRARTRAAIEQGRELQIEYRIRTRDGRQKWILARGRGVKPAKGLPVFEGLAIDITAQKEAEVARLALERKLLEGQKLESLGLLSGGLAHDFNNLLSTILGNAELGQLALPAGHAAGSKLRAIEAAAAHAAELCRLLLAYAGKGRMIVEAVDLSALVEGMRPLLKVSGTPRARLRLELDSGLPPVEADPAQLRQIVLNLVRNAAEALPAEGGEIRIRTLRVEATAEKIRRCVAGTDLRPGEYVCLEVSDNGAGMAPEVCARIFDPFFTTKPAGRGLGLSAVLGIVRGHGGGLCVTTAPGAGSAFHLLLPPGHRHPPATATGLTPAGVPWRHGGRALVIDDEPHVRAVMAEMLRGFGFAPEEFADGRDALDALQTGAEAAELVVLDVLMPGLGGEATLAELRVRHPGLPVLLMSGYTEYGGAPHLAGGGGVRFLPKPFTRAALERELRALLA